jgi:hypothetical protein
MPAAKAGVLHAPDVTAEAVTNKALPWVAPSRAFGATRILVGHGFSRADYAKDQAGFSRRQLRNETKMN